MWKARPVVATRVGGIEDQIEDGVTGVLVDDPQDLRAFGQAVLGLLRDGAAAQALGEAAKARVQHEFLAPRHLRQQSELILGLID
jgi:trehalose synthase